MRMGEATVAVDDDELEEDPPTFKLMLSTNISNEPFGVNDRQHPKTKTHEPTRGIGAFAHRGREESMEHLLQLW